MSAGAAYQEALRAVNALRLPPVAASDVLAVLEVTRAKGPLPLLYEAGHEAGLPRELLLTRCAGLFLLFAAGNLADDLIDGDCTYLDPAPRVGPSAQYLLQCLAFSTLAGAGIGLDTLRGATAELAASAGVNHVEVRTTKWTAPTYQAIAEGIAARQWAAYLVLLWAGTPLAPSAERVGRHLAVIGHVGEDVRSCDRRFFSMSQSDQAEVLAWARQSDVAVRALGLRFIERILPPTNPAESGA